MCHAAVGVLVIHTSIVAQALCLCPFCSISIWKINEDRILDARERSKFSAGNVRVVVVILNQLVSSQGTPTAIRDHLNIKMRPVLTA